MKAFSLQLVYAVAYVLQQEAKDDKLINSPVAELSNREQQMVVISSSVTKQSSYQATLQWN